MKRRAASRAVAWFPLAALVASGSARAQPHSEAMSRYLRQGADVMSVPRGDQPGAAYFSNGATLLSVPQGDEPGAAYFSQGASATGVPTGDEPGADYFSDGAAATGVPARDQPGGAYFHEGARATHVPTGDEPGAEYFSQGARATHVPMGDEPGADYFADGAEVTRVGPDGQFRWEDLWYLPRASTSVESEEEEGSDEGEPLDARAVQEPQAATPPPAPGPSPPAPTDDQAEGDDTFADFVPQPAGSGDVPTPPDRAAAQGSAPDAPPPFVRTWPTAGEASEKEPPAGDGGPFGSLVTALSRGSRIVVSVLFASAALLIFVLVAFVTRVRRGARSGPAPPTR